MHDFCKGLWVLSLFDESSYVDSPFVHYFSKMYFTELSFSGVKKYFITDESQKSKNRNDVFLSKPVINKIKDKDAQIFWSCFYNSIEDQSEVIKKRLMEVFSELVPGRILNIDNISIGFRFVEEQLPYTLEPHMDQPQKLAVAVIYVDSPKICVSGGTSLYRFSDEVGFELVKVYEFESNSIVLIPRVQNSWHGGEWKGEGTRRTLHVYFFWHPEHMALSLRRHYEFMI